MGVSPALVREHVIRIHFPVDICLVLATAVLRRHGCEDIRLAGGEVHTLGRVLLHVIPQ